MSKGGVSRAGLAPLSALKAHRSLIYTNSLQKAVGDKSGPQKFTGEIFMSLFAQNYASKFVGIVSFVVVTAVWIQIFPDPLWLYKAGRAVWFTSRISFGQVKLSIRPLSKFLLSHNGVKLLVFEHQSPVSSLSQRAFQVTQICFFIPGALKRRRHICFWRRRPSILSAGAKQ